MTSVSPLENVLEKGLYGNHEGKNYHNLIKIREIKNLLIVQIVQYKSSSFQIKDFNIDNLYLPEQTLKVNCNRNTRILWCGPKNWLLISNKKYLNKEIQETCNENDFAITDLSHSRTIIELEGKNLKEVLKKGCPFNINILNKNNCLNSIFNGIAFTADMLDDNPEKVRLFALRSFGESFCYSITDSCLEFGYKVI